MKQDEQSIGDEETIEHSVDVPISLGDLSTGGSEDALISLGDLSTGGSEDSPVGPSKEVELPSGGIGRVDRYLFLNKLGEGGFGAVYLAHDIESRIPVAIKVLRRGRKGTATRREEIRQNFSEISGLIHPNIALLRHLHVAETVDEDFGRETGIGVGDYLLVMEFVEGQTLSKWRNHFSGSRVPFDEAIQVLHSLAMALDHIHDRGWVHCDIKPSNILVKEEREGRQFRQFQVKILDFGLAVKVNSTLGSSQRPVGTRPYMAPEQWRGEVVDGRTDQYALGVLFFEMLFGAVPFAEVFKRGSEEEVKNVVLQTGVVEVPSELEHVKRALLRALNRVPSSRFSRCVDFVYELVGGKGLPSFRPVLSQIKEAPMPIRALGYYIRALEEEARGSASLPWKDLENMRCVEGESEPIFLGKRCWEVTLPAGLARKKRLTYGFVFVATRREQPGRIYYNAEPIFLCDVHVLKGTRDQVVPVDSRELTINRAALLRFETFANMSHDELDSYLETLSLKPVRDRVEAILNRLDLLVKIKAFPKQRPSVPSHPEEGLLVWRAGVFVPSLGFYSRIQKELIEISKKWSKQEGRSNPAWALLNGLEANQVALDWSPADLSVVQSNYEQSMATGLSLSGGNLIQVVSGPPGTGKSQFLLNLIANLIHSGKSVLLASKNNGAVKVPVMRLNTDIFDWPMLLHLGNADREEELLGEITLMMGRARSNEMDGGIRSTALSEVEKINQQLEKIQSQQFEREKMLREKEQLDLRFLQLSQTYPKVVAFWNWHNQPPKEDFGKAKWEEIKAGFKIRMGCNRSIFHRFFGRRYVDNFSSIFNSGAFKQEVLGWLERAVQKELPQKVAAYWTPSNPCEALDQIYDVLDECVQFGTSYRGYVKKLKELDEEVLLKNWGKIEAKKCALSRDILKGDVLFQQKNPEAYEETKRLLQGKSNYLRVSSFFPASACTTLSVGRRIPLDYQFDVVIIDEASQADIATALPLLFRARRAVIVGDENQLQPIVNLREELEKEITDACGITGDDYVRYSLLHSSLLRLAAQRTKEAKGREVLLKDHYRCHPEIIGFSNENFYSGQLRPKTEERAYDGIYFHSVAGTARRKWYNEEEVSVVCQLIQHLLEREVQPRQIGVVTPFKRQKEAIEERLKELDLLDEIIVGTAHTFQGDERDMMIFTLVIGDKMPSSTIKWLHNPCSDSKNILNVALTRARKELHLVGDRQRCLQAGGLLEKLVKYCDSYQKKSILGE